MKIRAANNRGLTQLPWLKSFHTFSFAEYYDEAYMGFGVLRVINDDRVIAGAGFPPHSHQNMEIISYVLEGSLQHKDSLNNGSIVQTGDVQRMSAGSGITHSEFNPSSTNALHFLQIWIKPDHLNYPPSYEQKHFTPEQKRGKFCLIASKDARQNSLHVHQNISIYAGLFSENDTANFQVAKNKQAWIQIASGDITINDQKFHAGDGIACSNNEKLIFSDGNASDVLLFEM